jgi:hypothetical protein
MSGRAQSSALVGIVLLAAWLGAAVFVAAVITPAAFAVLPTRALAGAIVGSALPVLFTLGILIGAGVTLITLGGAAGRAVTGGTSVLAITSAAALLVTIRLHALRAALGMPIDALDRADPRRVTFGQMHGLSVLLMGVGLVGASVALVVLARQASVRSAA